jgi:hypothetical protein
MTNRASSGCQLNLYDEVTAKILSATCAMLLWKACEEEGIYLEKEGAKWRYSKRKPSAIGHLSFLSFHGYCWFFPVFQLVSGNWETGHLESLMFCIECCHNLLQIYQISL